MNTSNVHGYLTNAWAETKSLTWTCGVQSARPAMSGRSSAAAELPTDSFPTLGDSTGKGGAVLWTPVRSNKPDPVPAVVDRQITLGSIADFPSLAIGKKNAKAKANSSATAAPISREGGISDELRVANEALIKRIQVCSAPPSISIIIGHIYKYGPLILL